MDRADLLALHATFCGKGAALIDAKNHDYSGAKASGQNVFGNLMSCEQLGLCEAEIGILIRMVDKIKRLVTHFNDGELKVSDESAEDSLIDLSNYAFLLYALRQHRKETDNDERGNT
ncbi:hypothetical protein LCGC14_0392120 [marine sediment metagenome]|uniref:Nucleotide modification associated domain-containing protein n=1 Tax=marine sediment metagenome TaxID=412755 RepID=A0A0F9W8A9_9ZZZZ